MRGYTKVPNNLLVESDLTVQERYLICVLYRYCGNKDTCFPSQKTLGQIMGFSDRYIRKLINNIIKKTNILGKTRHGWNRANTYTLSKDLAIKRNSSSYHLGSQFPLHQGTKVPPNSTYLTGKGNRSIKGMERMREVLERKGILKKIP